MEQQLDRVVCDGILEPVQRSDWAAPIVPVLKGNKSVRISGDFKITVNQVSKLDRYLIPRVEDLLASLAGDSHPAYPRCDNFYRQYTGDRPNR